jgi:hypothetical protein
MNHFIHTMSAAFGSIMQALGPSRTNPVCPFDCPRSRILQPHPGQRC